MFGLSKIWGYLAAAAAAIAGVMAIYFQGKSAGQNEYEKDAAEALRESEAEANEIMMKRIGEEREAIDEAANSTKRRPFKQL